MNLDVDPNPSLIGSRGLRHRWVAHKGSATVHIDGKLEAPHGKTFGRLIPGVVCRPGYCGCSLPLVPAKNFRLVTVAAAGLCKFLSCHCQADGKVSGNVLTIEFSFFWYFS
jgi:hypothetical protein